MGTFKNFYTTIVSAGFLVFEFCILTLHSEIFLNNMYPILCGRAENPRHCITSILVTILFNFSQYIDMLDTYQLAFSDGELTKKLKLKCNVLLNV